jgi:hypothetical protein
MDKTADDVLGAKRPDRAGRPVSRVPRIRRDAVCDLRAGADFFIYLVLSAQFESFVSPFVIMLTVPLAVTGALLACS